MGRPLSPAGTVHSSRSLPSHILILSGGVLLLPALYLLAPFTYRVFAAFETGAFIALNLIAFVGAAALVSGILHIIPAERNRGGPAAFLLGSDVRRYFWIVLALAVVGIVLRGYDNFVVRGFDISEGVTQARLETLRKLRPGAEDAEAVAGTLSIIGALLFSFTLPLVVIVTRWRSHFDRKLVGLGIAISSFVAIESLLRAGIMILVFYILFLCFSVALGSGGQNRALVARRTLLFGALLLVSFALGASFIIERQSIQWGSIPNYMSINEQRNFIRYERSFFAAVDTGIVNYVFFAYAWLLDYLLQGFAELSFLISRPDLAGITGGAYQFAIPFKAFDILGLLPPDYADRIVLNPRSGRYQTFIGMAYLDFGYVGAVVQSLLLGGLAQVVYLSHRRGGITGAFLFPLVLVFAVMSFLFNPFAGTGFYYLVGLMISALLFRIGAARGIAAAHARQRSGGGDAWAST